MRASLLIILSLAVLMAGCGGVDGPITPTGQAPVSTETASPVPPTDTPPPPIVYLQLTDRARQIAFTPLTDAVARLAEQDGYQFQQGSQNEPIPDLASIVITTGETDRVQQVLQHPSQPKVIAFAIQPVDENDRLTVIGPQGFRFERAAFLAGYIGAMLIPDHRTGMISSSAHQDDEIWRQAFRAGQQYYCGLCRAAHPPFHDYPVITTVPAEPSGQDFANAIAQLAQQDVRSIYLPPIASASTAFEAEPAPNFVFLTAIAPTAESANVAAVIRPAPEQALDALWPELQAGDAPQSIDMPIIIDQRNSQQFNDARLRLAQEVLDQLNSGFIQPLGAN